jgi:hypothetical protein
MCLTGIWIIKSGSNFMRGFQIILALIIILTLASCSTGYEIDGDVVYYNHWNEGSGQHRNKINADAKTFKIFEFDAYAKDNKKVFYQGEEIIGADASTFKALDEFYAKDKNFGWYGKDTIKTSEGKSFKIINSYYSTDGLDVFYVTEPLKMVSPKEFKFVNGDDDDECWTTDGRYYYYENYKIPSEDYKNFIFFPKSGGLSKDKRWVYFQDHKLNYNIEGKKVVDTIDAASFEVTGYIECRDKYGCFNVFHGRDKCEE